MNDAVSQLLRDGYQRQQAGELAQAERLYEQVLDIDASNLHALNLLGMLCVNSTRPTEAIGYITRAIEHNPDDAQAHANLGLACKDAGDLRRAVRHLQRSVQLDPGKPVVFNNLGNVLRALERPGDAIRSYERAINLHHNYAECWSNLSAALNDTGQHEPALKAVARALELEPNLAQAYNNRGDIFLNQADFAQALSHYRKASELNPGYTAAIINMAKVQRDLDQPDEALKTLARALEMEPGNAEAHHAKGVLLEQMGERERAALSFKLAIKAEPRMTFAHYQLAQIKGRYCTDEELATMQALWEERANMTPPARMYLAFGLARAYEHREEYDETFAYIAQGNRLKSEDSPYDDDHASKFMNGLVDCAAEPIASLQQELGCPDKRPVFVLGMPRSGTSLTEQILASHSEVVGAGELSFAYDTMRKAKEISGTVFPQSMQVLSAEQFRGLGEYYMSRHSHSYLNYRYVIDKTPLNFQYIGLLSVVLPHARFIHCHREPVSNCFSIHKLPFDKKQTYAHDLVALAKYYNHYWQLMQRWKKLLPGRILDVRYEDTVADVERQSQRMLDFLSLPFEAGVLEFHRTRRLVKTPSASQVRQPIYSSSVEQWKHYERHLEPLISNLAVVTDA